MLRQRSHPNVDCKRERRGLQTSFTKARQRLALYLELERSLAQHSKPNRQTVLSPSSRTNAQKTCNQEVCRKEELVMKVVGIKARQA
eukprot:5723680-Amphidinium_carterae.1